MASLENFHMVDAAHTQLKFPKLGKHRVRRNVPCTRLAGAGLAVYSLLGGNWLYVAASAAESKGAAVPKGAVAPKSAPAIAPVVESPLAGLNFLILALDDVDAARAKKSSGVQMPLIPAKETAKAIAPSVSNAAIMPVAPGAAQPRVEQPGVVPPPAPEADKPLNQPLAPIQPAAWPSLLLRSERVQSHALKTPLLLAQAKNPKNQEPLTLTPEPRRPVAPDPPFGGGATPFTPAEPAPPAASSSGFGALITQRTNRALGLAVPLRRTLIKAGSTDVLDTGFDGAPILRALNNRRLTQRTLDTLQDAVGEILQAGKVAPDDANLKAAGSAAARVGQTLGYRGVIVLAVQPKNVSPAGTVAKPTVSATVAMLVVDAMREVAEPVVFDETAVDDTALNEASAATGRAFIEAAARTWPAFNNESKRQLSLAYLNQAREALARSETETAVDLLNQSVALDTNQVEAYVLLGDLLSAQDAMGAASEYRRAAEMNPRDGKVWTKVAIAYTKGTTPDWPRALDAAKRALGLGFESAELRLAMAVAQWGRAEIFSRHDRIDLAREAEADARTHLDRALFLAPQDDPAVTRGIAAQLVAQKRFKEAVQVLDRIGKMYPDDVDVQMLLASSLSGMPNQEEEAFVSWAKVWRLSRQAQVTVDVTRYVPLMEGFDRNLNNLGKESARLTGGVLAGGMTREQALLQLSRLREDMALTQDTIKLVQPPLPTMRANHTSRIYVADLMVQALGYHNQFLETGDETFYTRAMDLHRQAIVTLNMVRTTR